MCAEGKPWSGVRLSYNASGEQRDIDMCKECVAALDNNDWVTLATRVPLDGNAQQTKGDFMGS